MVNLAFGWSWIVAGFFAGGALGMGFDRADFLGGYASWKRRLLRLAHVAMIALGVLNILFASSVDHASLRASWEAAASWALVAGAVLMPACCILAAWVPRAKMLFGAPIVALAFGATVVAVGLFRGVLS